MSQLSLRVARSPASSPSQRKSNSKVATRIVKPFVFEEDSRLTGFSVELWNEIAKQLNVATEYVVKPTVKELLSSVNNHEAALGIAAISITAERELHWDFSQLMFEAGLQILAPLHGDRAALIRAIFANLLSTAVVPYVLVVASILLIITQCGGLNSAIRVEC